MMLPAISDLRTMDIVTARHARAEQLEAARAAKAGARPVDMLDHLGKALVYHDRVLVLTHGRKPELGFWS